MHQQQQNYHQMYSIHIIKSIQHLHLLLLLLKIRDNYADRITATFSIYPSPKVSDYGCMGVWVVINVVILGGNYGGNGNPSPTITKSPTTRMIGAGCAMVCEVDAADAAMDGDDCGEEETYCAPYHSSWSWADFAIKDAFF
eukprot:34498_1